MENFNSDTYEKIHNTYFSKLMANLDNGEQQQVISGLRDHTKFHQMLREDSPVLITGKGSKRVYVDDQAQVFDLNGIPYLLIENMWRNDKACIAKVHTIVKKIVTNLDAVALEHKELCERVLEKPVVGLGYICSFKRNRARIECNLKYELGVPMASNDLRFTTSVVLPKSSLGMCKFAFVNSHKVQKPALMVLDIKGLLTPVIVGSTDLMPEMVKLNNEVTLSYYGLRSRFEQIKLKAEEILLNGHFNNIPTLGNK